MAIPIGLVCLIPLILLLPLAAANPTNQASQKSLSDGVPPIQLQVNGRRPSAAASSSGKNDVTSGSGSNSSPQFVPLQLRQKGHLVNAKFNRPNGPLQATVEFDKEGEKEAQNEAKTEQKAGGEKPALSTRAEFRGRDASGTVFRKRFNAELAKPNGDGKKEAGENVGANNAVGGLELGSGGGNADSGAGRKRAAELKERQPLAAVEAVKKTEEAEGKKDQADEANPKIRAEKEIKKEGEEKKLEEKQEKKEGNVKGIKAAKAAIRDGDSDGTRKEAESGKAIRDGDTDGTRKGGKKQPEKGKGEEAADEQEARKSEEWNTWSFLPALFGVGGGNEAEKHGEEAANKDAKEDAKEKGNENGKENARENVKDAKEKGKENANKNTNKVNENEDKNQPENGKIFDQKSAKLNDQEKEGHEAKQNGNSSQLEVKPSGGAVQLEAAGRSREAAEGGDNKACDDLAENCVENKAFCETSPYEKLMAQNCAKTCRQCGRKSGELFGVPLEGEKPLEKKEEENANANQGGEAEKSGKEENAGKVDGGKGKATPGDEATKEEKPNEGGEPGGQTQCKDISARCAQWAQRGFCTSRFFHHDLKVRFCAKSCGLCGDLVK